MAYLCPGCQSEMDVSSTSCQICLRPRSRQEMVRALQKDKHQVERKRRYKLGVFLAALAAGLCWHERGRWPELKQRFKSAPVVERAKARADSVVKANWPQAPRAGQEPPTPQQSFDAAANPEPPAAAQASAVPIPQTPAAPPELALPPAPGEEPPAPTFWRVKGTVYRLMDLKSVAGVEIVFEPTTGDKPRKARSDAQGRYSVSMPALQGGAGYRVFLRASGRDLDYLEEGSPAYRTRSRAQREDVLDETRAAPVLHVPLTPETSEVHQDFVLLPAQSS
jgi:hypothetical protein